MQNFGELLKLNLNLKKIFRNLQNTLNVYYATKQNH